MSEASGPLTVDDFIRPFVLRPSERKSGLSEKRRTEMEDTEQRRTRLAAELAELAQHRQFVEDRESNAQAVAAHVSGLESTVRRLTEERDQADKRAWRVRQQELDFMRGVLNAHGQAAALAENPGQIACIALDDKIEVTLTYGNVLFDASSASRGISVRRRGPHSFERRMSLGESGFDTLELLGLAQVLEWTGSFSESMKYLLPEPTGDSHSAPPQRSNLLEGLMMTTRDTGCTVQIHRSAR